METNGSTLIVNKLDEGAWRQFVDNHPQGQIFHTPEMFQVFAQVRGHQPELWAAVNTDGTVLALLAPVQVTLKDGVWHRLTTRAIVYGSVLYDPCPIGEEALAKLIRTYVHEVHQDVLFTEFRNLSDMSPIQPILKSCGFTYEDHLNYLIDLNRPVDEILQSTTQRTRKQIRRGLRKREVEIIEVGTRDQIADCYELLRQTYTTAHVPLTDRSLFEAAFDVLFPKGMIRLVLARVGNVYVGTSVELLYKDIVYGWYGGVNREYTRYTPNELLMWNILQWSTEHGYKVYDFGGAGKPNEKYGVRDFKAKFGGTLVCYGRNTFIHSPNLLHLSKLGYRLFRSIL